MKAYILSLPPSPPLTLVSLSSFSSSSAACCSSFTLCLCSCFAFPSSCSSAACISFTFSSRWFFSRDNCRYNYRIVGVVGGCGLPWRCYRRWWLSVPREILSYFQLTNVLERVSDLCYLPLRAYSHMMITWQLCDGHVTYCSSRSWSCCLSFCLSVTSWWFCSSLSSSRCSYSPSIPSSSDLFCANISLIWRGGEGHNKILFYPFFYTLFLILVSTHSYLFSFLC